MRIDVQEDEAVAYSLPDQNLDAETYLGGLYVGTLQEYGMDLGPLRSYLKFDLSSLAGLTVTAATLHVYLYDEWSIQDRPIGAYLAGDDWLETKITWNNAPPVEGAALSSVLPPMVLRTWYDWDVTAAVAGEAAGDGLLTIVLMENEEIWSQPTAKSFTEKDYDVGLGAYLEISTEAGGETPVADAGPDQTIEQTSAAGAEVTLDGSGSVGAVAYEWSEGGEVLSTDAVADVTLSAGVHDIVLTVTAAGGATDTDGVQVTVQDTTPPEFTFEVVKPVLWPANHKLVPAAVVSGVSDVADPDPEVNISVSSNEPINGPGDGNTDADWEVVPNGDAWEICLRAERAGMCEGREYTIEVTVTDAAGNSASDSGTVTVPHDQGGGNGKGKGKK